VGPGEFIFLVAFLGIQAALRWIEWQASTERLQQKKAERDKRTKLALVLPAFKAAARQMGFRFAKETRLYGACIEGDVDGTHVVAQCTARAEEPWLTTITVWPQAPLPHDVWFRSHWRTNVSLVDDRAGSSEPAADTGDPAFDRLIAAGGRVGAVRALLRAPARHAIVTLARGAAVRLRNGEFTYEILDRVIDTGRLAALIHSTLAALRTLCPVSDVSAALAQAAHSDPAPGVRARCLATLLSEEPDHPRTSGALDAALADPSDSVRVVAATALGERGVPVLREIAMREEGEEEPSARAIALLGRHLPVEQTLAILDSALERKRLAVAAAAIGSLGRSGDAVAFRRLLVLLHGSVKSLAVVAAGALGEGTSPATEPALIQALASSPALPVQDAIVRALGRVGSIATIAHLRAMLASGECHSSLVPIVQHAIAAIQARLTNASPGQVSLAEGESGQVSLVSDDRAGAVTISSEERSAPRAR
jgi:hypothetical protein